MKIIVLRSNFAEALSSVERGVGGVNSNLPILKNILLRAEGSKITAVSTNLEFAVTYVFPGKIIEDGEVAVPFSILHSIIKNVSSERITLESRGEKIHIETDNYEASVQLYNPKEYPIIPDMHENASVIRVHSNEFIDALQSVLVSTQYSEIRPEISGVFLKNDAESIFFVATDSFRLAEKKLGNVKYDFNSGDVRSIIPLRTAEEVLRIISNQGDKDVVIKINTTQISFNTDVVSIVSRLIDGNFPEYKAIIPSELDIEISASKQELVNAIKLTSSFSGKLNDISLVLHSGGKHIEFFSSDNTVGQNTYKVPAKIKGGKAETIVFNWKYLLDGIKIFSGSDVVIGINAPEKPVKIRDPKDASLVYVVMPIKN